MIQRDEDGFAMPNIEDEALDFIKITSRGGNVSEDGMRQAMSAGVMLSAAISLKRIADVLDRYQTAKMRNEIS